MTDLDEFDKNCKKAAQIIKESSVFLLTTGAGFSADSGLAVYKVMLILTFKFKMSRILLMFLLIIKEV